MKASNSDKLKQSLLVIIDPTAEVQPALDRAQWLARRDGYALELFICDDDDYPRDDADPGSSHFANVRESMMLSRRNLLTKLAETVRAKGIPVSCDVAWDRPMHEGIVRRVLRGDCALVLKDTHYHSAIRRALFSNTDWNLIRTCPCPLWLVKPDHQVENKPVLASVDPKRSHHKPATLDDQILEAAIDVAGGVKPHLQVLHAYLLTFAGVSADAATAPALLEKEIRALRREALETLVDKHDIPHSCVNLLPGQPAQLLPKLAQDLDVGLVVMGAVARGRVERILVGSTAEKVMDRLPCDLLVVKPDDFVSPVQELPCERQQLEAC